MSPRGPTGTGGAHLWLSSCHNRKHNLISIVMHALVVSWVLFVACQCKQVTQEQALQEQSEQRNSQGARSQIMPIELHVTSSSDNDKESPEMIVASASLASAIYYEQPVLQSSHSNHYQQQSLIQSGRLPQNVYTIEQQKYILDLLRNQQQQLHLLQQQHQQRQQNRAQQHKSHQVNYPTSIGSFYSLSSDLDDEDQAYATGAAALGVQDNNNDDRDASDEHFDTKTMSWRTRPFSVQLDSSYQQQKQLPSLDQTTSQLQQSSMLNHQDQTMKVNNQLPKQLLAEQNRTFIGSPLISNTLDNQQQQQEQIHTLIPVHSVYQFKPTTTTTTTTTSTTTPAPSIRGATSDDDADARSNAAEIVEGRRAPSANKPTRPKAAINLSSLIKPGEVLLSSKEVAKYANNRPGSVTKSSTSVVGLKEIETILKGLKPLALDERDKATGLESASPLPNDSPDAISAYDREENHDDVEEELLDDDDNQNDKRERLLPTSHLFGGSVGVVSVQKLKDKKLNKSAVGDALVSSALVRVRPDSSETQRDDDDQADNSFLAALETLGSQLANQEDPSNPSSASTNEDAFYALGRQALAAKELRQNQRRQQKQRQKQQAEQRKQKPKTGVPIELLVDHLMSGSRLATRRGGAIFEHHNSNPVDDPENASANSIHNTSNQDQGDDDDEDDDENSEEDLEDESAEERPEIPDDLGETSSSLAANESNLNERRVLAPTSAPETNRSNSDDWRPVSSSSRSSGDSMGHFRSALNRARRPSLDDQDKGAITVITGPGKLPNQLAHSESVNIESANNNEPDGREHNHYSSHIGKKKKRKKKKRRSKDHSDQDHDVEGGLVIGKRRLSRLELIRLIKVLNKMANSKTPSKERETSRKLLRHLIRVAVENYKKSQEERGRQEERDGSGQARDGSLGADRDRGRNVEDKRMSDKRLRDSLRSLLLEPTLGSSNSSVDNGTSKVSVIMQPWRVKSALIKAERHEGETDQDQEEPGDEDVLKEPPSSLDDELDRELRRPKTLVDISDDLERYFDTDFFEDLADKTRNSTSTVLSKQQLAKLQRGTKSKTSTPAETANVATPILLDARQADEADEEDIDLDHVRLLPAGTAVAGVSGAKGAGNNTNKLDGDQKKHKPKRARHKKRRRRKMAKKKVAGSESKEDKSLKENSRTNQKGATDTVTGHDDDDDDEREAEEPEGDEGEHKEEQSTSRQPEGPKRESSLHDGQERRGQGKDDKQTPAQSVRDVKEKKAKGKAKRRAGENLKQEGTEDEEEEEEEEQEPAGLEEDESHQQSDNNRGDRQSDVNKRRNKSRTSGLMSDRDKRRHRKRRRLDNSKKKKNKKQQKNHQLDRDEIPAPIVASRMSKSVVAKKLTKAPPNKASSKSLASSPAKATSESKPKTKGLKQTSTKTQKPRGPPKDKIETVGKGAKSGSRKPTAKIPDIKKPPSAVEVVNYFNEGLEVCEDGKCKLAMKSSHPKVKEQLLKKQPPDKRDLAGQIDKWLQDDGISKGLNDGSQQEKQN